MTTAFLPFGSGLSADKKAAKKDSDLPGFFYTERLAKPLLAALCINQLYRALPARRLISVHVFIFYRSVFSFIRLFIQQETKISHCVIG
ncbi:hypothetical protein DXA18_10460 [Dorea sp. AM58-8]|nr:hypothetical protein DXA18_10460 [Dorea sp. AM58-8]